MQRESRRFSRQLPWEMGRLSPSRREEFSQSQGSRLDVLGVLDEFNPTDSSQVMAFTK